MELTDFFTYKEQDGKYHCNICDKPYMKIKKKNGEYCQNPKKHLQQNCRERKKRNNNTTSHDKYEIIDEIIDEKVEEIDEVLEVKESEDEIIEKLYKVILNKKYKIKILNNTYENYDITNDNISIIQCYILTKFYESNNIKYSNILKYKVLFDNDNDNYSFKNYNIKDILILFKKIKYFKQKN